MKTQLKDSFSPFGHRQKNRGTGRLQTKYLPVAERIMRGGINYFKLGYSDTYKAKYIRASIKPTWPVPLKSLLTRLDDVLEDYARYRHYKCERMAESRLKEADRLAIHLLMYQEQIRSHNMTICLSPRVLQAVHCTKCHVKVIPEPEWDNDGINWNIVGAHCPLCQDKLTINEK